jgi:homeobox protein cut-like
MIPTLDNTASEIVQYQRDSTVQRKDLAQKTKDFRKLDDSAKLGEIKGLLKGPFESSLAEDVEAYTTF